MDKGKFRDSCLARVTSASTLALRYFLVDDCCYRRLQLPLECSVVTKARESLARVNKFLQVEVPIDSYLSRRMPDELRSSYPRKTIRIDTIV